MDRLTKRFTDGGAYCEEIIDVGIKGVNYPTYVGRAVDKLAEYENFEEIFRSKMTDAACDFLKDKEEFEKWLDRNKWIAKKCDEYARAEEQGKLLIFHCAVGDTVYVVLPTDSHITKAQINKIEIKPTLFGKICYFIEPVGNRGHLYRYFGSNFGKSVFLTKEQAEEALKGSGENET